MKTVNTISSIISLVEQCNKIDNLKDRLKENFDNFIKHNLDQLSIEEKREIIRAVLPMIAYGADYITSQIPDLIFEHNDKFDIDDFGERREVVLISHVITFVENSNDLSEESKKEIILFIADYALTNRVNSFINDFASF